MNRGLPSARPRIAPLRAVWGRLASPRRFRTTRPLSSRDSSPSSIWDAVRRPAAKPGRSSCSSWRAVQTKRSGTPSEASRTLLDEIEEGGLRPVDVVEDHHERPAAGQLLKDRPHAPEQLVLAVLVLREAHDRLDATGRVGQLLAEAGLELDAGVLLAVLRHDPGRLSQHLGQRPEGDAVAVGQAAAPQYHRLVGEAPHELLDEPALADPGLAEQRDEPALGSGDRTAELRVEGGDLAIPADERPVCRSGAPHVGGDREQPVGRDGFRLALQRQAARPARPRRLLGPAGRWTRRSGPHRPGQPARDGRRRSPCRRWPGAVRRRPHR